jgi:hypothetical protein
LGDRAIGEAGVGIDKKEEFALGFFGKLVAGPRLSSPTFWEGLTCEEADAGVSLGSTLDEGGGAVGGVVVENKNFHIWVVAVGDGTDAWWKAVLLIAGGNEN